MWSAMALAAAALGGQAPQTAVAPQPQVQAARDERPLLWRGLRAGMSPAEVRAALTAQGIRTETGTDPETHRQFVATRDSIREAGRSAEAAFGFVDDRLFYVEVRWGRMLSGRIRFERSNFTRVAGLLEQQFGPPVSIDSHFPGQRCPTRRLCHRRIWALRARRSPRRSRRKQHFVLADAGCPGICPAPVLAHRRCRSLRRRPGAEGADGGTGRVGPGGPESAS